MLVVPTGSGNDFAKALGIRSVELRCAHGSNFVPKEKMVKQKTSKRLTLA